MFPRSRNATNTEPLGPMAEVMADAFESIGDFRAATDVLSSASRHGVSPGLAIRRAERALGEGDATQALEILIPPWEAGFEDVHLEALMALSSLALGLYDVVESLTDGSDDDTQHGLLFWLLRTWEGDAPELPDLSNTSMIWKLRGILQTLAQCGRTDLVHRSLEALEQSGPDDLLTHFTGLPRTAPARCTPCVPPLEGREAFSDAWPLAAPDAVFSWAWNSARQVLRDERVLLLAPEAALFEPFYEHGRLDAICPNGWDTDQFSCEPEDLDVAPGQFEHVCAFFWLENALDPARSLERIARAMNHEGQLHLLAAGPQAEGEFDLRLSQNALERLAMRVGLEVLGSDGRTIDGMPCDSDDAAVIILRAEKRVV